MREFNYKNWRKNLKKHYSIMMIIGLLVFASGCLTLGRGSGILTSKEQQWTIPKDTKFYAIQTPKYKQLTEFTAEDDLAVLYKGKLIELEKDANDRAFKLAEQAKIKGILWGAIPTILLLLTIVLKRKK